VKPDLAIEVALAIALVLSGCRLAPVSYDLHREGRDAILFPPKKFQKASTTSDIPVTIKGARKHPSEIARL
jgi:hypothetical protein